jgi:hypothetical protein
MYPHVSREINGQPILVGLVKPEASLHRAVAANNLRRLQSSTVRVVAASNWSQMENYMIEAKPLPACPQGRLGTWLHIQWGQARSPSIRVDLLPPPQVSDSLAIHIHRQSHNHLLCLYNSVDIFFQWGTARTTRTNLRNVVDAWQAFCLGMSTVFSFQASFERVVATSRAYIYIRWHKHATIHPCIHCMLFFSNKRLCMVHMGWACWFPAIWRSFVPFRWFSPRKKQLSTWPLSTDWWKWAPWPMRCLRTSPHGQNMLAKERRTAVSTCQRTISGYFSVPVGRAYVFL